MDEWEKNNEAQYKPWSCEKPPFVGDEEIVELSFKEQI